MAPGPEGRVRVGRGRVAKVVGMPMGRVRVGILMGGKPPLPPPGTGVLSTVGMVRGVTVGFPLPGMVNEPPGGVSSSQSSSPPPGVGVPVGPAGSVAVLVAVAVVPVWSLKAPPGIEKEVVVVVVALAGTLPVELWVFVSVAVELLSVGSQSSPPSVAVAAVKVAVLELDVIEAVFVGPEGVVEEVPDWKGTMELEVPVVVVVDDITNWPPGGPEEVLDEEAMVLLSVGSQSSVSGGAVEEGTPIETDVVKN